MADKNDSASSEPKEAESLEESASVEDNGSEASQPQLVSDPQAAASPPAKVKRSPVRKITESKFLYLGIFLLVLIGIGVLVLTTINWSKAPEQQIKGPTNLSNAQLAALAANTTVVGDAKQTLSVQSNAIFTGQVLMKQGLDVAGTLKVGGGLSLPSITVGGNGSFGQLEVNDTLSVAGNSVVQGQLTVQKGLTVAGTVSIGALSVATLSVTNLQLNSDLQLTHHLVTSGGAVGRSSGTALGNGGTTSVSGNDNAGTVSISTGSGTIPAGCFINISFVQKFATTPHVIISPSNSDAAGLNYYTNRSNTGFSVCSASAPPASTTFLFDYFVSG